MDKITSDIIILFLFGIILLTIAGIQFYSGKVFTRGRRGFKWHEKAIVSKEEAPFIFRAIITIQLLIGTALILITCIEMYYRLQ